MVLLLHHKANHTHNGGLVCSYYTNSSESSKVILPTPEKVKNGVSGSSTPSWPSSFRSPLRKHPISCGAYTPSLGLPTSPPGGSTPSWPRPSSLGVLPGYVWVAGNKSRPPKRKRMAVRNRFLFRKPQAAFHMVSILELIPSTIPLLMGYRA